MLRLLGVTVAKIVVAKPCHEEGSVPTKYSTWKESGKMILFEPRNWKIIVIWEIFFMGSSQSPILMFCICKNSVRREADPGVPYFVTRSSHTSLENSKDCKVI